MKNFLPRTFWATFLLVIALFALHHLPPLGFKSGMVKTWFGLPADPDEITDMRRVDLLDDIRVKSQTEETEDDAIDPELVESLKKAEEMKALAEQIVFPDSVPVDSAINALAIQVDTVSGDTIRLDSAQIMRRKTRIVESMFKDTVQVPHGVIEIEDFDDFSNMGIDRFYEALAHVKDRPVRIGFFGDSFIEGDIFTGSLRSLLQKQWGGKGVGYVEIAPETAGFRTTVKHRHKGWSMHQSTKKKSFVSKKQGLACHYFTGGAGAWVEGTATKLLFGNNNFDNTSFFYYCKGPSSIRLVANAKDTVRFNNGGADSLISFSYANDSLFKAHWTVSKCDSNAVFYGMAMDGKNGIILDNLSMRGHSGSQISSIPLSYLKDMHKVRDYDLIVIQFGLNVASKFGKDFSAYQKSMEKVVRHLHEAYPNAGFLILSVGDRAYRNESGEMSTMPGVNNLSLYQKNVAVQCKVSYWNMLEAMKQEGGVYSMAKSSPSLANMDYTHINFRGGSVMAQKLFDALKAGKEHYDRKLNFVKSHEAKTDNSVSDDSAVLP